jgi:MFS family permease
VVHPRSAGEPSLRVIRRSPDAVRLVAGYTGHSWELLGSWQWLPAFLAASLALSGGDPALAAALGAGATAVMHVCGSIAASTMGTLSDRLGRRRVLVSLALASTILSFGLGWLVFMPFVLLVVLALLYGFVSVGDSPVLSTALTEAVAPQHLGAALATRSVFGFGAGALAPVVFGAVLDAASPLGSPMLSWGLAFASLGVGGVVAVVCARGLLPVTAKKVLT